MLDYDIKPFDVPCQFRIDKFYTMMSSTYNPDEHYYAESYNYWECSYICEGSLCNVVDGKVYHLEKGDMIFYKPMGVHRHYIEDEIKTKTFFFSFSFEKFPEDFVSDLIYKLNSRQRKIMEKIMAFADNITKATIFTEEEIIRQKSKYLNYDFVKPLLAFSKNPTDMKIITNYIEELFVDLYYTKNFVKESVSFHSGLYKTAVYFMNNNLTNKITVPDIAKHCCISESTLKKVFYEFSNMSVHKHLLKLKIKQATILLNNGASAHEISEKIGFASQAYFTAAFKRETGLTPREYISKYRN